MKQNTLIVISLGLLGFIANMLSLISVSEKVKLILAIIFSVSIAIGFGKWLFETNIKNFFNNFMMIRKLGIRKIYDTGKGSPDLNKKIKSGTDIKIMVISGDNLIKGLKNEMVYALAEKRSEIKLLIGTPGSEFIQDVENAESRSRKGQISAEIRKVVRYRDEYIAEAKSKAGGKMIGNFEIRFFNTELRSLITIVDNKWAWITPHFPPARALQSMSFEVVEKNEGLLIKACVNHFDTIWNSATRSPVTEAHM
jgi:hypothetical protein